MIKIIYVKPGAGFEPSIGCFEKVDELFIKETGYEKCGEPAEMNKAVDKWLKQFGGKLDWNNIVTEPDFIVFENDEDATAFSLRFVI